MDMVGRAMDDHGVARVEYRIDGEDWATTEGTGNWIINISLNNHTTGYLWVEVRAYDGTSHSDILMVRYYNNRAEDEDPVTVEEPYQGLVWLVLVLSIIIGALVSYILYDRRRRRKGDR